MTARLRLLLAILVLALAPVLAPAAGWASASLAVAPQHECDHPCDTPAGIAHPQAVCGACSGHLVLAPLAVAGQGRPVATEAAIISVAEDALPAARWPPPLRPPRA